MHFVKVFLGPSGWGVTFTNYMLYMLVWGSSMPVVMCVCVCVFFLINIQHAPLQVILHALLLTN